MSEEQEPYRVLARKYRPQNFDELIGQDALVRTLSNAIESGRVAHAFMLTGVRGVGKTTTARIIAKALNYTGADGSSGPTTGDTSDCQICQAISEDRHPDVMEMDAASRTGIDDIREILDGIRFAASEARYKIYIIDEVHMLSKQAFNALLKTLEEPPEHVKFIFATTEIRKVPITVLSRCQRFDLRRVDSPTLVQHFSNICEKENVCAEVEALASIARAADGSVRDGLSLLDQAIALSGDKEDKQNITVAQVQDMLGLADRARNMDLLDHVLSGNIAEGLQVMDDLYKSGGDSVVMVQDLLDLTHYISKLRAVPAASDMKQGLSADHVSRLEEMAKNLSMPTLSKTWQILLKGLGEVQSAPNPQAAAEMVIIRLSYAADLPDPNDLIKRLSKGESVVAPDGGGSGYAAPSGGSAGGVASSASGVGSVPQGMIDGAPVSHLRAVPGGMANAAVVVSPDIQQDEKQTQAPLKLETLEDIVAFLDAHGEVLLSSHVYQFVHLVKWEKGAKGCKLDIALAESAHPMIPQNLRDFLNKSSGMHWMINAVDVAGQSTLAQQAQERKEAEIAEVLKLPVLSEIMETFPEAELADILRVEKTKQ